MTDKQTIIDGVDVSGCEYCLKMTKYRCTIQRDVYKYLCEENPNCHYKKWKRKEELLKSATNHIKDLDLMVHNGEERENELEQKLKRKEQECEAFKKARENSRCAWKSLEGTFCPETQQKLDQLKAENEELKKENAILEDIIDGKNRTINWVDDRLDKYDEVITKIRDVLGLKQSMFDGITVLEQILQKISEVIPNE